MCDVPSIAVFCSESIKCFPGTASTLFLKLLVTIPVAPIITGINVHFKFHICFISIHKLLYYYYYDDDDNDDDNEGGGVGGSGGGDGGGGGGGLGGGGGGSDDDDDDDDVRVKIPVL
jgi:uncharacterized membrane protein YgcG